ncbi:MAG: hypothetical protein GMKNLPBB_01337 [Myxococcota bacterium]|nr:hypothetical protein [Myxococcota bacterium]
MRWYSPRIQQHITAVRWGHYGKPVLIFPTAGGDAEEIERFHLIGAIRHLIDAGRIKVYSCDSVSGRVWTDGKSSGQHRAWMQNRYDEFICHEMVPAIRMDCRGAESPITTVGASIGAFNAVAAVCRHPEIFHTAIGMSGTYDLEKWTNGQGGPEFYFCSPMHFLPNLGEGPHLSALRKCFILMAYGEGRWENPAHSWRLAGILGAKGVPNYVDNWGPGWDHDWPSWRKFLPGYLERMS